MPEPATHTHRRPCERPRFEVADIFRRYGAAYRAKHKLSVQQHKVMRAIEVCRTAVLGGHIDKCDTCDYTDESYNSCRNRHCPKCQGAVRQQWVRARLEELLPIPYYHVGITLPHLLNNLALCNKAVIYDLFFKAGSFTLLTFGRDPRHLGAELGFIGILHTWGQQLEYHVHLHFIVTGGGLSLERACWKALPFREKFLFPVKAMSKVMRGKFITMLRAAYQQGKLQFPGALAELANPVAFEHFLHDVAMQEWVIYSKKPFAGPEKVLEYMGRYTNRVAISNHRLQAIDNGKITLSYKDYRDDAKTKTMTLSAEEFIRRFLLHVVPKGFKKIRHGGLFGYFHRAEKIALAQKLLEVAYRPFCAATAKLESWREDLEQALETKCPMCQRGILIRQEVMAPRRFAWVVNTS
jgi:hypothetical protein